MRPIIPILLIALFFACDDTEHESEPIDRLVGTWGKNGMTIVPSWEDPYKFDDWLMIFDQDGQFTSIDNPYLSTDSTSTWSYGCMEICDVVILNNIEGGINSFQISGFVDTAMTIAFTYIGPVPDSLKQELPEDSIRLVCCMDGTYVIEMAKK